ncbi:MAG: hypothetical protein ACK6BG_14865 [Cyanobacteriota bacterium]
MAPTSAVYARELAALLDERGFWRGVHLTPPAPCRPGEAVLIMQLSDLHFNEQVDITSNRYDFSVASARLAKLASRVKQLGRSYGANKAVVACLGDFLNSDRRLDELLSNATNRSMATLLAVDILRAFLLDLSPPSPAPVNPSAPTTSASPPSPSATSPIGSST